MSSSTPREMSFPATLAMSFFMAPMKLLTIPCGTPL
jgi:hypothetical protein